MRLFPRLLLALLAVTCLAAPATADARTYRLKPVKGKLTTTFGIADQKPGVFADARFGALGMRHARRSVAWDALHYDWQVADIDAWMNAARAAGVTPLVTFARSRIGSRRHMVPSAARLRTEFRRFRARYPWVRDFVASNESNHFGEPTGRRPKLAAQYYKALKGACKSCRIAAATLLDYPNMVSWAKRFVKAVGYQPRYWAMHNYISANRFDLKRTRAFLKAVKGDVWVTEVGGMVANRVPKTKGKARLKQGTKHAAKVTRFIFGRVARVSRRISRIYLYHWNSEGPRSTWDSGFFDHRGKARPAFTVLQRELRAAMRQPLKKGRR